MSFVSLQDNNGGEGVGGCWGMGVDRDIPVFPAGAINAFKTRNSLIASRFRGGVEL